MRLRFGVSLIIISWLPIAQLILFVAHNNGQLTSDKQSSTVRLIVWTIQILVGLIGVWLVGKLAVAEAKQKGWKQTPKVLWHIFLHGKMD